MTDDKQWARAAHCVLCYDAGGVQNGPEGYEPVWPDEPARERSEWHVRRFGGPVPCPACANEAAAYERGKQDAIEAALKREQEAREALAQIRDAQDRLETLSAFLRNGNLAVAERVLRPAQEALVRANRKLLGAGWCRTHSATRASSSTLQAP